MADDRFEPGARLHADPKAPQHGELRVRVIEHQSRSIVCVEHNGEELYCRLSLKLDGVRLAPGTWVTIAPHSSGNGGYAIVRTC